MSGRAARPGRALWVVAPLVPRSVVHGDVVAVPPEHSQGAQDDGARDPTVTVHDDLARQGVDVDTRRRERGPERRGVLEAPCSPVDEAVLPNLDPARHPPAPRGPPPPPPVLP